MSISSVSVPHVGGFKRSYPKGSTPQTTDTKVQDISGDVIFQESNPVSQNFIFNNFTKFPSEIHTHIFSQVYDSTQPISNNLDALHELFVSKPLSRNTMDAKINWINALNLSLKTLGCKNADEAVAYVIKHKLTSANFSEFPDFNDGHLKLLGENCSQILHLSINSNKISGDVFAELLGKLTMLQSLDVRNCIGMSEGDLYEAFLHSGFNCDLEMSEEQSFNKFLKDRALADDKIAEALGKLTMLQDLNLSGCQFIKGYKFAEAIGKLTKLRSLDLSHYRDMSEDKKLVGDRFAEETCLKIKN